MSANGVTGVNGVNGDGGASPVCSLDSTGPSPDRSQVNGGVPLTANGTKKRTILFEIPKRPGIDNDPVPEDNPVPSGLDGGAEAFQPSMPMQSNMPAQSAMSSRSAFPVFGSMLMPPTMPTQPSMSTPLGMLNTSSTPDARQPPVIVSSTDAAAAPTQEGNVNQEPIGTKGDDVKPIQQQSVFFTTDFGDNIPFQGGHYLRISGIDATDTKAFEEFKKNLQCKILGDKPSADGALQTHHIAYDDMRDAERAKLLIECGQNSWTAEYILQSHYAEMPDNGVKVQATREYDGQVSFNVTFDGPFKQYKHEQATDIVRYIAAKFGQIRHFDHVGMAKFPNIEYRVEYFKITDAWKAIEQASVQRPAMKDNYIVVARPKTEFATTRAQVYNLQAAMSGEGGITVATTPPGSSGHQAQRTFVSPTGRTAWSLDSQGNTAVAPPLRVLPNVANNVQIAEPCATYFAPQRHSEPGYYTPAGSMGLDASGPRRRTWNGPVQSGPDVFKPLQPDDNHNQYIDLDRIRSGVNTKTTVMMRNLPNRMNIHQFRECLDACSWGKYDFAYLRIDFQKGTNVGYAFVNFSTPEYIIEFVEHWKGRCWTGSGNRRVEFSYATIQGLDCLVEKFRNSAIMSEFFDFRPKMFWTFETAESPAFIGKEIQFPEPNNHSKKQRSLDNAGQIGLYAPRSGHAGRERGRRSQFDRGTPSQVREDALFNDSPSPHANNYAFRHGNHNGGFNNGYGMGPAPRMHLPPPPPPQFNPMMFNHMFGGNPYMNGNGMIPQHTFTQIHFDHVDPFAAAPYDGGFHSGHYSQGGFYHSAYNQNGNGYPQDGGFHQNGNGYHHGNVSPGSRSRSFNNGVPAIAPGGPVHSPNNGYSGYMMPVAEADDESSSATGPPPSTHH